MASENNDIGDIVKKCKILLLDIEGTTTSISFVKDKLFPYAEANVKEFLETQWENETVKEVVAALRKLAIEDEEKKMEGVVTIPGEDAGKQDQIEGLVKSVQWQMSADRKVGPLKQLQGLIWKQGYEKGDIKGHVYDDVSPALKQWRATEGQKVYIYSSGSVQAQKLLFGQSVAGDLMPLIEGYFDTAVGAKQEPASYSAIAEKIGCKPEDILFLSDILKEAEAARASGLHTALVIREGNTPLPSEAAATFPVIHSLDQLTVSNKRKPDPQDPQEVEQPAKVPKTDIEADVKTASDAEAAETTTSPETVVPTELVATETKNVEEPEKMEVEEENIPVIENSASTDTEKKGTAVRIETIVEEVTNSNDTTAAAVCDIEPVVEENIVEKTEKNETEKMDTDSSEITGKEETVTEPKENIEQISTVVQETPSQVITVQEVTNDIAESAEIIDDLVPVVEEPLTVEMEDLKNVGEVLEKECDEILSKVQDITNLDIRIKPMLNPIAEEPADTENGENINDIVESILNSEMELGTKPCEDIDANTVQEITPTQAEIKEKQEVVDTSVTTVTDGQPEKNATDNNIEEKVDKVPENNVTVENVVESSLPENVTGVEKSGKKKEESETVVEVTNGDLHKCTTEAVEDKMEVGSTVTESVTVSEEKETSAETTSNKASVKESLVQENIKMDSEECVEESIKNQNETNGSIDSKGTKKDEKDSIEKSKPVKNDNTMETDTVMKEEDSTVKPDNHKESENSSLKPIKDTTDSKEKSVVNNETESENNGAKVEKKLESVDIIKSDESVPKESQKEESVGATEAPVLESKSAETNSATETVAESKDSASEDIQTASNEKKVNGDANTEVTMNGVTSKDDELNARLSVENGENNGKEMNGANGNGDPVVEKGQGDNKMEKEIPDIKKTVKTVTSEEPRSDPIEQPTEA